MFSSRASALVRGRAQVQVERIAELVRLGGLVPLAATSGAIDPVAAECVPLQPREQVVEHLLADLPAAPRRQLEPLPVAGQIAGLLEPPGEVVERIEIADRLVAKEIAHLVAIDPGEVARCLDVGERVLQPLHRLEPADLGERAIERE